MPAPASIQDTKPLEEIIDIGRCLVHTEAQRPFFFIARRFFAVVDFYRAVFSPDAGWGGPMFPCITPTFTELGDGHYEATLTLDERLPRSRVFALITEGNIIGMPEVLGHPPAEVTTEVDGHSARFEIHAPFQSSRLARARRRLSLPFRATELATDLGLGQLENKYPHLAAWNNKVEARPDFAATFPPHWKK